MTKVTVSDLRHCLSDYGNKVAYGGERVLVERNHKPLFALVSIEDFEALEALEEKIDIQEAKKALKKGKFIPLEQLEEELGI